MSRAGMPHTAGSTENDLPFNMGGMGRPVAGLRGTVSICDIIRMSSWLLLWQWKTKGPVKVRNRTSTSITMLPSRGEVSVR